MKFIHGLSESPRVGTLLPLEMSLDQFLHKHTPVKTKMFFFKKINKKLLFRMEKQK